YRWYDSQKISPLFPFGYGLSYTSFALRSLKAASEIRAGDSLLVSVNLANTGSRAGAEFVQVYVAAPTEAGEPPRQLKAFTKVSVRPNQVQRITGKLAGPASPR